MNQTICSGDSIFLNGSFQNTSGIYSDTLQTVLNCDSIINTTLTVGNTYNDTINISICQGDSMFLGGFFQNSVGTYIDSLQSFLNCDSIITSNLSIDSMLVLIGSSDTISSPCNAVYLNVSGGNSYLWSPSLGLSCSLCPNPIATPNTTTTYTVVDNSNSCNSSFSVTVFIEGESEFIIPNVFSPNGDGNNDDFNIKSSCIYSLSKKIYNRWGTLLFQSNQINEVWNGRTTSGKEVPEGTYFYIFDVETIVNGKPTSKIFKGTVSLLR
ncbi:MAG: gliding motility-associated C-terminal domain-containing protein [Flavobacteriales bacterium]|nr:gliding motility-associated C-terminal domain-containing protein [Flavobacteriales bacterium]